MSMCCRWYNYHNMNCNNDGADCPFIQENEKGTYNFSEGCERDVDPRGPMDEKVLTEKLKNMHFINVNINNMESPIKTTTNPAVEALALSIVPKEFKSASYFSVLFFYSPQEIGAEGEDGFIYRGSRDFTDYRSALDCYSNTRCAASQLINADTLPDLEEKKNQMIKNFSDEEWLNENVYPYI